ncbi:hypothetical protein BJY04DRAFT_222933 [Aspergillus karnatakaensis]|uniref:uncharacterized protein n=1 Tax=Aspergillus karnatakaensis TaxID=1810916 RepID=UPI003CCD577F
MATQPAEPQPQPAKRFACDRCREQNFDALVKTRQEPPAPDVWGLAPCVLPAICALSDGPLGEIALNASDVNPNVRDVKHSGLESRHAIRREWSVNAAGDSITTSSQSPEESRATAALDTGLFQLDTVSLSGLTDILGPDLSTDLIQSWISSSLNDTIFQSAAPGPSDTDAQKDTIMGTSTDSSRKLSALAASLSEQLNQLESAPWSVTLVSIVCANQESETVNPNPLGEVLQSTTEFTHILHVIIALKTSPSSLSSSLTQPEIGVFKLPNPNPQPPTQQFPPDSMFCSQATTKLSDRLVQPFRVSSSPSLTTSQTIHTPPESTAANTRSSPQSQPQKPNLNIATALMILACYTQLIQIYNILFSRVHESLSDMSHQSISSTQAPSGLQLGGFPVQYGDLQIKILIQPSRRLDPASSAKGSPATDGSGLFDGTAELTALLRVVMSQNVGDVGTGTGEGIGDIVSLRQNMKKITQLLEQNPAL